MRRLPNGVIKNILKVEQNISNEGYSNTIYGNMLPLPRLVPDPSIIWADLGECLWALEEHQRGSLEYEPLTLGVAEKMFRVWSIRFLRGKRHWGQRQLNVWSGLNWGIWWNQVSCVPLQMMHPCPSSGPPWPGVTLQDSPTTHRGSYCYRTQEQTQRCQYV